MKNTIWAGFCGALLALAGCSINVTLESGASAGATGTTSASSSTAGGGSSSTSDTTATTTTGGGTGGDDTTATTASSTAGTGGQGTGGSNEDGGGLNQGGSGGQGGEGGGNVILAVKILIEPHLQEGDVSVNFTGQEIPARPQGLSWGSYMNATSTYDFAVAVRYATFNFQAAEGSQVRFNGNDADFPALCADGLKQYARVAAFVDGEGVPVTVKPDGNGGCDYWINVIPPVFDPDDADGDGYAANIDCNDSDPLVYPAGFNSWPYQFGENCTPDMGRVYYVQLNDANGDVTLYDAASWSVQNPPDQPFAKGYTMTSIGEGWYGVDIDTLRAPDQMVIRYWSGQAWVWESSPDGNGGCTILGQVTVSKIGLQPNSSIAFVADPAHNCYWVKQP